MNYYKQGDAANADKIKAAFESEGYSDKGFTFDVNDILFFTANNKHINVCPANGWLADIIKTHPDYKELELPVESKFKVGDWVVRKNGETLSSGNYAEQITLIEVGGKGKCIWLTSKTWIDDDDIRLWTIKDAEDGDVLATDNGWTCIFKAFDGNVFSSYCFMDSEKWFCHYGSEAHTLDSKINGNIHPATKEQRPLFFKRMREVGYQWDDDKKELRKIIEPKFEVGDRIKWINHDAQEQTITDIKDGSYITVDKYGIRCALKFVKQDEWERVPKSHYDIANFKAGMAVLVREYDTCVWQWVLYSHFNGVGLFFAAGKTWRQCIPFDGNEHLLGTTDMPSEEYINW